MMITDKEREEYFKRMEIKTTEYLNDHPLKFGSRYTGTHYFGDQAEGILLDVSCSSDGKFADLRLDNGSILQDVYADSLKAQS